MAHLPKYEQIKRALLAELRAGTYPPGERIPTREELIRQFGVTRTTVNQALKELVGCGVLQTSRRGGTIFTGKQPPLRVAFISMLGKNVVGHPQVERTEVSLLNPLLYKAAEFNLEFIDIRQFHPESEFMDRCDCVVAVLPDDKLMAELVHYPDKVLFINRYGENLNFISTNHRAAVRELTAHNIAAAGKDAQVFFLAPRFKNGFVERERAAGFIDECAAHELFYRVCEFESGDSEVLDVLNSLPVQPGRPVVMCAPSLLFTGAVIKWARERNLVFGRDIFYSDFDNPHARRNTGEEIASAVQGFAEMGQALYRALCSWGDTRTQIFIPHKLVI